MDCMPCDKRWIESENEGGWVFEVGRLHRGIAVGLFLSSFMPFLCIHNVKYMCARMCPDMKNTVGVKGRFFLSIRVVRMEKNMRTTTHHPCVKCTAHFIYCIVNTNKINLLTASSHFNSPSILEPVSATANIRAIQHEFHLFCIRNIHFPFSLKKSGV